MSESAQAQHDAAAAAQQAATAGNLHLQQIQLQQQQLQQQHMQMQMFWQNQIQEISTIDPGNTNNHPTPHPCIFVLFFLLICNYLFLFYCFFSPRERGFQNSSATFSTD